MVRTMGVLALASVSNTSCGGSTARDSTARVRRLPAALPRAALPRACVTAAARADAFPPVTIQPSKECTHLKGVCRHGRELAGLGDGARDEAQRLVLHLVDHLRYGTVRYGGAVHRASRAQAVRRQTCVKQPASSSERRAGQPAPNTATARGRRQPPACLRLRAPGWAPGSTGRASGPGTRCGRAGCGRGRPPRWAWTHTPPRSRRRAGGCAAAAAGRSPPAPQSAPRSRRCSVG